MYFCTETDTIGNGVKLLQKKTLVIEKDSGYNSGYLKQSLYVVNFCIQGHIDQSAKSVQATNATASKIGSSRTYGHLKLTTHYRRSDCQSLFQYRNLSIRLVLGFPLISLFQAILNWRAMETGHLEEPRYYVFNYAR